jgi:hypothetical protein
VITGIGLFITVLFDADVDAQAGAYATGVLVLMTSAAIAVTLAQRRRRLAFAAATGVFLYTTIANIIERPEGLHIATWFIVAIIGASLVSRAARSTEIRIEGVDYDDVALRFVQEAAGRKSIRIIAHRPNSGGLEEYARKRQQARQVHNLRPDDAVLFLEVQPGDASTFADTLRVQGVDVGGHRVLRCTSPAIPNAIAGLLLDLRDRTFGVPHAYFGWTEGNPMTYILKFLALGEGDTAPVCREVLRRAEPDPDRRPRIHLG